MQKLGRDIHRIVARLGDVATVCQELPVFVAGGFVRDIVAGAEPKDVDVWAAKPETLNTARDRLTALRPGERSRIIETERATTIVTPGRTPVQFIRKWEFGSAEDCIKAFDFTVCAAAIWWEERSWHSTCHGDFYRDLAARRLVYTDPSPVRDPAGSLWRATRFLQKGYSIAPSDFTELIAAFNKQVGTEHCTDPAVCNALMAGAEYRVPGA